MSEIAVNSTSRSVNYAKLLAESFMANGFVLALAAFALLANQIVFAFYPQQASISFLSILKSFCFISLPFGLTLVLVARTVELIVHVKPTHPIAVLRSDLARVTTNPAYIINGLPVMLALLLFSKATLEFKPEIPFINGFKWDETFVLWDRALHMGIDPWRIVQVFMGHPIITFIANMTYSLWVLILTGIWVFVAFHRKPNVIHTRFVISFMLTWWIGGCVMALIFSSAGPAFYGRLGLTSPDPYADLLVYLNSIHNEFPMWVTQTQDKLWNGYIGTTQPLGLSAFPSMHNASAVLFALMFCHVSKGWGRFFNAYAILIFLTSVHLGWHYAVDGYMGAIVAFACWHAANPLARWVHRCPAMSRFEEGLAALQP